MAPFGRAFQDLSTDDPFRKGKLVVLHARVLARRLHCLGGMSIAERPIGPNMAVASTLTTGFMTGAPTKRTVDHDEPLRPPEAVRLGGLPTNWAPSFGLFAQSHLDLFNEGYISREIPPEVIEDLGRLDLAQLRQYKRALLEGHARAWEVVGHPVLDEPKDQQQAPSAARKDPRHPHGGDLRGTASPSGGVSEPSLPPRIL